MEHIYKKFGEELSNIKIRLSEMGNMVENQVAKALELINTVDLEVAQEVIKGEKAVNNMTVESGSMKYWGVIPKDYYGKI